MKKQTLLIISAHADDHISCAGTVMKLHTENGYGAYEIVLTDSSQGQNFAGDVELSVTEVAKVRSKELSRASKFLGIVKSFQMNLPDLGLAYSDAIMYEVVRVIREVRPSVVFLHNSYDAHPDHLAAHEIGLHALKISAMGVRKETLGKSWRVPKVLCMEGMLPVESQILVDVTAYAKRKAKLFAIYTSQASSQAQDFVESLSRVRGYHLRKVGATHAEAFTVQNQFPILYFDE